MSAIDESLTTLVREAVRAEIGTLAVEVRELRDRVGIARQSYTTEDLWRMCGGEKVCKLASFRQRKDLPKPDSKNGRWNAYSQEAVDAFLRGQKRRGKK